MQERATQQSRAGDLQSPRWEVVAVLPHPGSLHEPAVGRAGCPQPAADHPEATRPRRRGEDTAPYQCWFKDGVRLKERASCQQPSPDDVSRPCQKPHQFRKETGHQRQLTLLPILLLVLTTSTASARTITLKPEAIDAFATLSENHPRSGWAAQQIDPALYVSNPPIGAPNTSCLIRYSFDQIPKGNRITHAEWVIPAGPAAASNVTVWRVIAEWGIGVCHQFRMVHPKRLEWSVPGARGRSVDRATRPTGSGKFGPGALQVTVNVTQDVELWHSGAAPNRGWLLTFDSPSIIISPTHAGRQQWQLRITYEPE